MREPAKLSMRIDLSITHSTYPYPSLSLYTHWISDLPLASSITAQGAAENRAHPFPAGYCWKRQAFFIRLSEKRSPYLPLIYTDQFSIKNERCFTSLTGGEGGCRGVCCPGSLPRWAEAHQLEYSRAACGKREAMNEGNLLYSAVRDITEEAVVYNKTKHLTWLATVSVCLNHGSPVKGLWMNFIHM